MIDRAGLIVIVGTQARIDHPTGTPIEGWDTDEPSPHGIERTRLIRNDIAHRVQYLTDRLLLQKDVTPTI